MKKPVQERTLKTRAKLLLAAENIVVVKGFTALRVDDVVQAAGVAKGTFFAHFADKDALLEIIIGARIEAHIDAIDVPPAPVSVPEMVARIMPLITFLTQDRYVFNVVLRHSGATATTELGPIALTVERQITLFSRWIAQTPFRKDVHPHLLAEGVQAFITQCITLHFCAVQGHQPIATRLATYLDAWLLPPQF